MVSCRCLYSRSFYEDLAYGLCARFSTVFSTLLLWVILMYPPEQESGASKAFRYLIASLFAIELTWLVAGEACQLLVGASTGKIRKYVSPVYYFEVQIVLRRMETFQLMIDMIRHNRPHIELADPVVVENMKMVYSPSVCYDPVTNKATVDGEVLENPDRHALQTRLESLETVMD